VTNGLEEGVFKSGQYTLVARGKAFEQALSEYKFDQSGAVDDNDSQATKFGHAIGANFVCYATLSKYSETLYRISYKMIDVSSGEIVNVGSETIRNGVDGLLTATDDIAKKLFNSEPSPYNPLANNSFTNYTETTNNLNIEMVAVQGGTFTMGCTSEQGSDCDDNEKPAHQVTVSSFYIGKYEVTQAQWEAVMHTNPSYYKGDNLPVEFVSWYDVQEFIRRLNTATGKQYRLLTEAEWEFAARGGNKSHGYKYSGSNNSNDVAWFENNSGRTTHPVGTKSPNELSIYDMSGNVDEWCQDWYGTYPSLSQPDPMGPSSSSSRVYRGGSFILGEKYGRCSERYAYEPRTTIARLGFRIACSSN